MVRHMFLNKLKKHTAMSLAIAMTAAAVLPWCSVPMSVEAADPNVKAVTMEKDITADYLADNLKSGMAKKADKLSDTYWKEDAPKDVKQAARKYAKDVADNGHEFEGKVNVGKLGSENHEKSVDESKLQSDPVEKKFDENGLRELGSTVRVTYTVANTKYLKKDTKTIDDLMTKNREAFLTAFVSEVPVYEMKGNADTYVAFLNYGGLNGYAKNILDYSFITNVQTSPKEVASDVVFDKKTGIVYIPKSYYFATDGTEIGYDLQSQILVAPEDISSSTVSLTVENDKGVMLGDVKPKMDVSVFNGIEIPLVDPKDAGKVSFEDIDLYANDMVLPQNLIEGENASYDSETGVYTLNTIGATIYSLKFHIKKESVVAKIFDFGTLEAKAAKSDAIKNGSGMNIAVTDKGKPLTPSIDVKKLAKKDVFNYTLSASGNGTKSDRTARRALKYQKSYVYGPWLPGSTPTCTDDRPAGNRPTGGNAMTITRKFYDAVASFDNDGDDAITLSGVISRLEKLDSGLVSAEDMNPNNYNPYYYGGPNGDPEIQRTAGWYAFMIGAPYGDIKSADGSKTVNFGKASEWKWSETFTASDGENVSDAGARRAFAGICCHPKSIADIGNKTNQVSVLDIASDDSWVVLGLTQLDSAISGNSKQAGSTIIKIGTAGSSKLKKSSSDPKISEGACYSLEGATYHVYTDKALTNKVGSFVCNASGESNEVEGLTPGKYYVQEDPEKTGKNFLWDKTIHEVTVIAGKTAVLNVSDIPAHTDPNIQIAKIDEETGKPDPQGDGELAGAWFRISHYDTTEPNAWKNMQPSHVYIAETDEHGRFNMDGSAGRLVPASEAGERSDTIPKTGSNTPFLAAGTYTVYEIKAPVGYKLPADPFLGDPILAPDSTDRAKVTKLNFRNDPEPVYRGGFKMQKRDIETDRDVPQGDAKLGKATYEVINLSKKPVKVPKDGQEYGPNQVCFTFETDENGAYTSAADLLPYGSYKIVEKSAPTGHLLEGKTEVAFEIREDGKIVDLTKDGIKNPSIRGGVAVIKFDKELNKSEALGGADHGKNEFGTHLEGTTFELKNISERSVMVEGKEYEVGAKITDLVIQWDEQDKKYIAKTPADYLPYGTYEIKEVATHESYLLSDGEPRTFQIRTHGQIVGYDAESMESKVLTWDNQVVRGDMKVVKIADGTSKRLSVPFEIENVTTHEKHILVTDKNGMGSTETSWNAHTKNTNANDKVLGKGETKDDPISMKDLDTKSGIYFGLGEDGSMAKADDKLGALPYGKYIMRELHSDTNKGYEMQKFEFSIERNDVTVNAGTLTDDEPVIPEIETKASVTKTGSQMAIADGVQSLSDKVMYKGLKVGEEYELEARLMEVVTEDEKSEDTTDKKDEADASEDDKQQGAADQDSEDKDNPDADQKEESSDKADQDDAKDESKDDSKEESKDEAKVQAKELLDKDGKPYIATLKFKAEKTDGEVTIEIKDVDFSKLTGKHLVFFEKLKLNGNLVASHEDPEDEDQSIYVPEIGTKLLDKETEDHYGEASKEATHIDYVTYHNLIPGKQYTMVGTLQEKVVKDGKTEVVPVKDAKGKEVTAKKTFTPAEPDGVVEIEFTYDASLLAGKRVVAFEKCYEGGISSKTLIGIHEDPEDPDQTVTLLKIGTVARDSQLGKHVMSLDGHIVDRVYYTGLTEGEEYELEAVVIDKKTGKPLLDADGKQYVGTKTFKAEATGETSEAKDEDQADAKDSKDQVKDESQKDADDQKTDQKDTEQKDTETKDDADQKDAAADKEQDADKKAESTDDAKDQKPDDTDKKAEDTKTDAKTDDQKTSEKADTKVSESELSAPEGMEGWKYVDVEIPMAVREHIGKNLVVFEYLKKTPEKTPDQDKPGEKIVIAKHEDPSDDDQTVVIPKIATQATAEDGSKVIKSGAETTILDTVTYENLEPGREYVMKAVEYDKSAGKVVEGSAGELTFKAGNDGSGEVVVPIKLNTSAMKDGVALVAFEECYDKEKNVPVAEHKDPEDMKQTVSVNVPLPEEKNPEGKNTQTIVKENGGSGNGGGRSGAKGSGVSNGMSPKTGLQNPAIFFAGAAVILIGGYVAVSKYRKKEKK